MLITLLFLFSQILKDNKDKRDAEFNERFKHSECWSVISILSWYYSFNCYYYFSNEKTGLPLRKEWKVHAHAENDKLTKKEPVTGRGSGLVKWDLVSNYWKAYTMDQTSLLDLTLPWRFYYFSSPTNTTI